MTFFKIFSNKKEDEKIKSIVIDYRERNSLVPAELARIDFKIDFRQLPVADYILGDIAIERKTISDLKSSIINKRIFSQLSEIKQYPKHFIIIEGSYESLFNNEILKGNAVRGFLLSLLLNYKIPVIYAENEKETASYISILANKTEKEISFSPKKFGSTKKEQISFVLESFPGIGPKTAEKLLKKFGSLRKIFEASEEELFPIIGKKSHDFLDLLEEQPLK